MAIPQPFTTAAPTLVNFDFQDILADLGYVSLSAMEDLADSQSMVRQAIASDDPVKIYVVSSSGLQAELNYDFEFRTPQRIDGLMYVTITFFATATSTQSALATVKARILHYDGSTETEIGAQQASAQLEEERDSSTKYMVVTFSYDVNKAFAKGDKLRLEFQMHAGSVTNTEVGFLADPANRDFGQVGVNGSYESTITPSSKLEVLVPFDLEN